MRICYATATMMMSRLPLAACGRAPVDYGWAANWGIVTCADCLAARNSTGED